MSSAHTAGSSVMHTVKFIAKDEGLNAISTLTGIKLWQWDQNILLICSQIQVNKNHQIHKIGEKIKYHVSSAVAAVQPVYLWLLTSNKREYSNTFYTDKNTNNNHPEYWPASPAL